MAFDESTARPTGGAFDPSTASPLSIDSFPGGKPSGVARRAIGDPAVALARGIVGIPESLTGIADLATGGRAGKVQQDIGIDYKGWKDKIGELYSPEAKAAQEEVNKAQGFFPTVGAMLQNPSTIVNSAVESAPTVVTGGLVSRGARALAPKINPILAGAIGEGATAAGQNAEQVRQGERTGLLTPEQSAILAASGVATGVIGNVAGRVANKLGIGDVSTMVAAGKLGPVGAEAAATGAKKGVLRKIGEGALVEGVGQELPQSYQEQVAQNLAQGKPWDEGAANAGAQGMLAGGLMGAVAGPLGHGGAHAEVTPGADAVAPTPAPTAPIAPDLVRAQKLPETGPLSGAVNAGIEHHAQTLEAVMPPAPRQLNPEELAAAQFYVEQRRNDGTPAGQDFAARFDAGQVPPEEALNLFNIERAAPFTLPQPAMEANELTPEQADQMGVVQPAPLEQFAATIPTGDVTDLAPEQSNTDTLQRGLEPAPDRAPRKGSAAQGQALTSMDMDRGGRIAVAKYLSQMRQTNTPAARAFMQDFLAGRITRNDVLAIVRPQAEQTTDQRLAAAAAQREQPQAPQSLILTADGFPYGTRAAAVQRATRESLGPDSVVQVPGGFAVQPESSQASAAASSAAATPQGATNGNEDQAHADTVAQEGRHASGQGQQEGLLSPGAAAPSTTSASAPAVTSASVAPKMPDGFYSEPMPDGRVRLRSAKNTNSLGAYPTEAHAIAEAQAIAAMRNARTNQAHPAAPAGATPAPAAPAAASASGPRVIGSYGRVPKGAQQVELRTNPDGTLTPYTGKYAMVDYESGQPIVLPATVTDVGAVAAIKKAGAIGQKDHFYGVKADSQTAPANQPEAPSQPAERDIERLRKQESTLMALRECVAA